MPPCTFPFHTKKTFYYKVDKNFIYKVKLLIKNFFDEYVGINIINKN
jgi:hypothetical protein